MTTLSLGAGRRIRGKQLDRFPPIGGEVFPGGVVFRDQRDFLFAAPFLDFGFAGKRVVHIAEDLVVRQAVDAIAAGESCDFSSFVLHDAGHEEAGNADVTDAAFARLDVDVVALLARGAHGCRVADGEGWRETTIVDWEFPSSRARS